MPIIWDKKYSVGLEEIDEQHKVLVNLINNLESIYEHREMYKDFDSMLNKVMGELKNYTVLHFTTEEVLMKMFQYGEFEDHKESHDSFVKLVVEQHKMIISLMEQRNSLKGNESAVEKYNQEIFTRIEKILTFLQKWLISHIMRSDTEYVGFFTKIQKKAASSGGWLGFLRG